MEKEYVKVLLEQGRITYNTQESHIKEEPIFSALSILLKLPQEQIVETELNNKQNIENELDDKLKPITHYYLGDLEKVEEAIKAVEDQGKAQ